MKKTVPPPLKAIDRRSLAKKAFYNIESANREYLGLPPKKKGETSILDTKVLYFNKSLTYA